MSKVLVTESNLQDIADAIRSKNQGSDTYRPGDMAAAILAIPTGGGSTLVSKTITQNGEYDPEDDNADGYSDVTVNVPNSYTAEDEGKVVSSGALVAQTSRSVTENGTYDTTENDEVVVNVSGGGGGGGVSPAPTLPSEYQEVQYLEFNEAYYTVTIPQYGIWCVEFEINSGSTPVAQGAFGYRTSSSNTEDFYFRIESDLSVVELWHRGDNKIYGYNTISNVPLNTKVTLWGTMSNLSRNSAYVGAYFPTSSSNKYWFYGKIYSIAAYMPGQVSGYLFSPVYKLVPCYRKSDNTPGLYEVVGGTFYGTKNGSGTIVAGPAVV